MGWLGGSVGNRMFHQNLLSSLEMEVEGNERPHQKGCYRAQDETEMLNLELQSER